MFSGCTGLPESKETKLGGSNQQASQSAGKNIGIVLVLVLWQMSSQWGSQKLLQGLVSHELTVYISVFNKFLSQWIMAISLRGCKSNNFEPHNSLKLSFTNIWGLHSNFVECESSIE